MASWFGYDNMTLAPSQRYTSDGASIMAFAKRVSDSSNVVVMGVSGSYAVLHLWSGCIARERSEMSQETYFFILHVQKLDHL